MAVAVAVWQAWRQEQQRSSRAQAAQLRDEIAGVSSQLPTTDALGVRLGAWSY